MKWLEARESNTLFVQHRMVETVHKEKSPFQEIEVIDTVDFGRMLLLDGIIQTSVRDEFIYHEMIAHVPLFTHPNPERVLVIGGGDGGTVREVLKHPGVQHVHLVEIDQRVVEVSKTYLPELSRGFDDPRVKLTFTDGIEYVKSCRDEYDVILIDAPDPEGPAVGLFTYEFYQDTCKALREDGVMAAQTESPFMDPKLVKEIYDCISKAYPACKLYTAHVPTYSMGIWSFILGLRRPELFDTPRAPHEGFTSRYYTPEVHRAAFALPKFVQDNLGIS